MRQLCKSGGGGGGGGGGNISGGTTIVATVVAVLEKQHQQNFQRSFPLKYRRNIDNSNQNCSQNSNSSCSNSADEHFQTAVKDFDSVADDVERIVQQTNSLKREKIQQQQETIKTERTCSEDFYRQKSGGGGDCFIDTDVLETDYLTYRRPDAVHSSTVIVNNDSFSDDDDDDDADEEDDDVNNSSSDSDSSSSNSDDSSGKEHVIGGEALATIAEEEHNTTPTSSVTYKGLVEQEDGDDLVDSSSLEDEEATLKDNTVAWTIDDGDVCNSFNNSTTDISSTTSSEQQQQQTLKDSSTRCNNDFQWMQCKEIMNMEETIPITKPPINRSKTPRRDKSSPSPGPSGSLDRLRHHHHHQQQQQQQQQSRRQQRDQKARSSSHILKSPPPRLDDFTPCQNWCCNPSPHETTTFYDNYHYRRSEPPNHIDSSSSQHYGSHPDLYANDYNNRYRHEQMIGGGGCCSYHMPPPCCFYGGDRLGYHWSIPYLKPSTDQDEKLRKLQYEKENLQLQVQVLQEQIEAQSDKIIDLEKTLNDKKQILQDTEEKLQQEVLTRSSLETQKLELMSIMSELKLQQATLERENIELRSQFNNNNNNNTNNNELKKPPRIISGQNQLLSSTPVHHATANQGLRMTPSPSPVSLISNSPRRVESTTTTPKTSQHEIQPPKTPPATYKRQIDIRYGSLPRQQFINNGNNSTDSNANPSSSSSLSTSKKGVAFGRGLSSLIGVRAKGYSVPNLAETEKIVIEDGSGNVDNSGDNQTIQFGKNTKGIKKIFGRMKRSGSGNLDDLPGINEFQRGGVRATAAARLGWSEPQLTIRPDKPFNEWDTENICDWLQDLGLDQYITDAKRWIKDGQQLQEASINDIEKELNIKNPLHKKKLQLALIDMIENGTNDPYLKKAGKLDTAWILRWLDDTGLPQYKENFLINRIDGRVLHRLTIDDLQLLHITSLLHVVSIKRGIQVLRENDYEANCLQRRSLPDDPKQPTPKQITLWTTHRCMEWLRQCDLAEYAPNLRGAGVHGGLFVYETKFTGELLATLLSIPPGKTLLRRHLNTRFNELLGKEIIQEKRDAENTLGYIPLTPSAKLKIAKKSQFSLKRKKSKSEADYGDLVCPLNPDNKQSGELNGSALNNMGMMMMKMVNQKEEDASPRHVEYTVRSSPASIANSPLPQRHV